MVEVQAAERDCFQPGKNLSTIAMRTVANVLNTDRVVAMTFSTMLGHPCVRSAGKRDEDCRIASPRNLRARDS